MNTLAAAGAAFILYAAVGITGAHGQTNTDASVPLSEIVRDHVGGNWVEIPELDLQKVETARSKFCRAEMFDPGEMNFKWGYDEKAYAMDIPVLRDATGQLALRWNSNDDLYIAKSGTVPASDNSEPVAKEESVTVYRATAMRMTPAGSKVSVTFGWANKLPPAVSLFEVSQWSRRSLFLEVVTNKTNGQAYALILFPLSGTSQREPETKLYVKCT